MFLALVGLQCSHARNLHLPVIDDYVGLGRSQLVCN